MARHQSTGWETSGCNDGCSPLVDLPVISVKLQGSQSRQDGPWITVIVSVPESAKSLGMLVPPGAVDEGGTVSETCTSEPLLIMVVIVHGGIEGVFGRWMRQSMDVGPPEGPRAELILLNQEVAEQVQTGQRSRFAGGVMAELIRKWIGIDAGVEG